MNKIIHITLLYLLTIAHSTLGIVPNCPMVLKAGNHTFDLDWIIEQGLCDEESALCQANCNKSDTVCTDLCEKKRLSCICGYALANCLKHCPSEGKCQQCFYDFGFIE